MKFGITLISLLLLNQAGFSRTLSLPNPKTDRFESANATGLDAVMENGLIYATSSEPKEIENEIIPQLFYLAGALNTYSSGAELGHLELKIGDIKPVPNQDLFEVHYSVSFTVGWAYEQKIPSALAVTLPNRTDESGLNTFFKTYASKCSESPTDPDLNSTSFYYYYRPWNRRCPLKNAQPMYSTRPTLKLKVSALNSEAKSPEYEKVWEDGKLVVTAIFGTYDQGATSDSDAGIYQYNLMYRSLINSYGKPKWINVNLAEGSNPGSLNPDVEMSFTLADGREFNIDLLLIDKVDLQQASPKFEARYNERTKISDYVSYNGHSGFGENIRALAKMGTFVKGQYQIYLVNGCDTFFYVDDSLRKAHQEANPGSGSYQYFDIITNAMPSLFNANAQNNLQMISALIGQKMTYKDILRKFHPFQHTIVMGEEDNRWPLPFNGL